MKNKPSLEETAFSGSPFEDLSRKWFLAEFPGRVQENHSGE